MLRNIKPCFELVLLCLVLTACSTKQSTLPSTPTSTPATAQSSIDLVFTETPILPSPTPLSIATPTAIECATFEQRELEEPYQRDKNSNQPRYTLSAEELDSYLALMGVESLCIPLQLGAPLINVDWNSQQSVGATTGRMLSIGFQDLYYGAGWSEGHIVYATYDFAIGAMYDTFATPKDRDAVENGTMPDMIEVDGVKGFIRFKPGISMGTQPVHKTYVFPFETYYIAVVYDLGAFDPSDIKAVVQKLKAGEYPADRLQNIQAMDFLALSMQFQSSSQP